jgi:methylglyoxal/glyoxal reductase
MVRQITDCVLLNNGVEMPWLGLGVYKAQEGKEVEQAVETALQAGYRSVDTAAFYHNETGVGHALKQSGIARDKLFVTTKVWNTDQGYEATLAAFDRSRKKLGLDYLDLYLIHWPVPGMFRDTWRALEKLYRDGWVRAIGVSNFQTHHLQELLAACEVPPAVNQVEFHPLLTQEELRAFCEREKIQLEAWSPLMRGNVVNQPMIVELAQKYGKTPAQLVLRWDLQHGVVTIPKSVTPSRIEENADIFDFEISPEDMARLDGLNQNHRFGQHPDHFKF